LHIVSSELSEAGHPPKGVLIVIDNGDLHGLRNRLKGCYRAARG
jgi:hypothetical protein